jgi:hypothetical protein
MIGRRGGPTWRGELVTVLVAIVVFLWFIQMRRAPMQLMERRICERRYEDALTAAETLAVDAGSPMESQVRDSVAVPCGALRKAGRLEH